MEGACRIMNCCAPENLPRTSITTNSPANCGAFGYRIRNRPRGDFQIEGVSEELCERFSKRDAEIDEALAKLLADKPELGGAKIAELRAKLATEKRTRKQKDLSRDELRTIVGGAVEQIRAGFAAPAFRAAEA